MSEKLDGRLNDSFQVGQQPAGGVHRGLGELRELSLGVTDLKKMLGGVKTRGVWGEVQLRALLEQLFAPGQYIENAAIPEGLQTRVEFALKLPTAGPDAPLLPIDSKFPQEDYLRLVEAAEAGDREAAAAAPPSWSAPCWSRRSASTTSTSSRPRPPTSR